MHIRGFDNESRETLVADCQNAGAEVIEDDNYKSSLDYLILPVDAITMDGITVKAKNSFKWSITIGWWVKRFIQIRMGIGCSAILY